MSAAGINSETKAMEEFLTRFGENLINRLTGPLQFRLFIQPTVAIILAVRAGLKDAREDRPAYGWTILTNRGHRKELLTQGWQSVAKVFVMAIIIDGIYQCIVLRWFYPGEALIVAVILALLPYLLIRGPVNRIARLWRPPARPRAEKAR